MNNITLITPPDFFENDNFSVLFLGMTESDQDKTSRWLAQCEDTNTLNLYCYQGENNLPWLLYALNRADIKFLNFDSDYPIINFLGSYMLGKPNVYYTTQNTDLKELMSHINNRFVPDVETFLNETLNAQR
jgi:hypothetical protein